MIMTYSFPDEVSGRVMQEGFEDGHQCVFVLSQEAERDLTGSPEWS
jgi:hypothetical protein